MQSLSERATEREREGESKWDRIEYGLLVLFSRNMLTKSDKLIKNADACALHHSSNSTEFQIQAMNRTKVIFSIFFVTGKIGVSFVSQIILE